MHLIESLEESLRYILCWKEIIKPYYMRTIAGWIWLMDMEEEEEQERRGDENNADRPVMILPLWEQRCLFPPPSQESLDQPGVSEWMPRSLGAMFSAPSVIVILAVISATSVRSAPFYYGSWPMHKNTLWLTFLKVSQHFLWGRRREWRVQS